MRSKPGGRAGSPAEPSEVSRFQSRLKPLVKAFCMPQGPTSSPALPLTIYGVSSLLTCSCPCREHSARVRVACSADSPSTRRTLTQTRATNIVRTAAAMLSMCDPLAGGDAGPSHARTRVLPKPRAEPLSQIATRAQSLHLCQSCGSENGVSVQVRA